MSEICWKIFILHRIVLPIRNSSQVSVFSTIFIFLMQKSPLIR